MWAFENLVPWAWINTLLAPLYAILSISPSSVGKFGFKWTFRAVLFYVAVFAGLIMAIFQYWAFYSLTMPIYQQSQEVFFMPNQNNFLVAQVFLSQPQVTYIDENSAVPELARLTLGQEKYKILLEFECVLEN